MSLIQCPECKKEVSNMAKTCPNCGYSLKKKSPIIIIIAALCAIIAICILLSGLTDLFHSKASTSAAKNESTNFLLGNYYMGTIDTRVYVFKFCDGNILEIVDCGWGRASDTRQKEYGTYEIDENTVTIVLNGKDSFTYPILNEGESFSIGDNTFNKVSSSELSSETLEAFD